MSEFDWDQSEDTSVIEHSERQSDKGMDQVRKAYERQKKQNDDLKSELEALKMRERERVLSDTISAKGLNAKIAGFYPQGGEVSADAVDKWLSENADVFGLTAAQEREQETVVPEAMREAYDQMAKLSGGDRSNQSMSDQINGFKMETDGDYEKFIAFMRSNPNAVQNPTL